MPELMSFDIAETVVTLIAGSTSVAQYSGHMCCRLVLLDQLLVLKAFAAHAATCLAGFLRGDGKFDKLCGLFLAAHENNTFLRLGFMLFA